MRNELDPDHWCNGGEHEHPHPDALYMEALDVENNALRAELEQLRQALHDRRIENSGQAAEIERLRDKRRWIPIREQLPEASKDVLVCHAEQGWCRTSYYRAFGNTWHNFEPTHWMPLPDLPNHIPDAKEKAQDATETDFGTIS